jgi:hypothetical protein
MNRKSRKQRVENVVSILIIIARLRNKRVTTERGSSPDRLGRDAVGQQGHRGTAPIIVAIPDVNSENVVAVARDAIHTTGYSEGRRRKEKGRSI